MADSGTFWGGAGGDDGVVENGIFRPGSIDGWFGCRGGYYSHFWLRFVNVTIPPGSLIKTAYFTVRAANTDSASGCNMIVYCNDEDDAVAPTNTSEFNALSLTTGVAWNDIPAWTWKNYYNSIDFKAELQEVVGRGGFSSGNAVMVVGRCNSPTEERFMNFNESGYTDPRLYVEWIPPGIITEGVLLGDAVSAQIYTGYLTEGAVLDDDVWGQNYTAYLTEGVVASDQMGTLTGVLSEEVVADDITEGWASVSGQISEAVELDDDVKAGFEYDADATEAVELGDAFVAGMIYEAAITEGVIAGDEVDPGTELPVMETGFIYETLGWTWIKRLESTAEISDEVSISVGIPVVDVLTAKDDVEAKWSGTESVTSTLGMFGTAVMSQVFNEAVTSTVEAADTVSLLHRMISAVTSSLEATETVSSKLTCNPEIMESVAITGLLTVLRTLNETVNESATIQDTLGFSWIERIEDGGAIADAVAVRLLALHVLTSDLVATDTAAATMNFTDAVTDTLGIAAAVAVKQLLQEHITDILHLGLVVELEGELWECWVLNTNAFHASVYSGFSFNSYAVHNNTAYGCKRDGVYKLTGNTDDGSPFKAGIVLPESRFGTHNFKRFRKAYFGMAGTSPAIKLENEDGTSNTYTINNSKVTPTRGVKGRRWTLSVEGFDNIDFIELAPIMLTR